MSLDKAIQHGKEYRKQSRCKPYRRDCCLGTCPDCDTGRLFKTRKRMLAADELIREYEDGPSKRQE